jgi:hypothetical protein
LAVTAMFVLTGLQVTVLSALIGILPYVSQGCPLVAERSLNASATEGINNVL